MKIPVSRSSFIVTFVFGVVALCAAMKWHTRTASAADDPVIETESGRLRGIVGTQEDQIPRDSLRGATGGKCCAGCRLSPTGDGREMLLGNRIWQ